MTIQEIARALVSPGKGILAADESPETIGARFAAVGIENTPENRRAYRHALCTTPGLREYISGVIMHEETFQDTAKAGVTFPELLTRAGVLSGIKVDKGTAPLAVGSSERHTLGLDDLSARLAMCAEHGASFAKWRAVFLIGEGTPSSACIQKNAGDLAMYASMCQRAGLVPIVEPEVLMEGGHTMARCAEATTEVLKAVFGALAKERVAFGGMLLKPNMIVPGKDSGESVSSEAIAHATVRVLMNTVPAEVPGIVFLSGGQSELEATNNLNEMYLLGETVPWRLSFSFGRALQDTAMRTWGGADAAKDDAQRVFLHRAEMNSLASLGEYELELEAGE